MTNRPKIGEGVNLKLNWLMAEPPYNTAFVLWLKVISVVGL